MKKSFFPLNTLTDKEIDLLLNLSDFSDNEEDSEAIKAVISDPFNPFLCEDLRIFHEAKGSLKPYTSKSTVYYVYNDGRLDDFGLVVEKRKQTSQGNRWLGCEQISRSKLVYLFENKLMSETDYENALDKFSTGKKTKRERKAIYANYTPPCTYNEVVEKGKFIISYDVGNIGFDLFEYGHFWFQIGDGKILDRGKK